ncbi:hypothetical protein P2Q00_42440 [Streptomyces coacervatus]|uniref:hypothetical protein n=1 Tax=Streptomyces coacervatus TaxID=647381 RepID=UPI0023DC227B|nr:hypothetical protein [Streptomyces coacervatus]MDF2272025.1 hypothetical protein [Streptomyces coacervatus]
MAVLDDRRELMDQLRRVLVAAQKERHSQPGVSVVHGGRTECEWITFERTVMHEAVNRIRAGADLPLVPRRPLLTPNAERSDTPTTPVSSRSTAQRSC